MISGEIIPPVLLVANKHAALILLAAYVLRGMSASGLLLISLSLS